MATFTWTPDAGAQIKREPRIRSVGFGDAYEQRAGDGLNTDMRVGTFNFTGRSASESSAIIAFLAARGGHESFDYAHLGGTSYKWVCKSWTEVDADGGVKNVTGCEFRQVPA